ncbi:MAG: hypothetical protein WBS24_02210 [Terriglobales bacterium]
MYRRAILLLYFCLCAGRVGLRAQEFKLFDREVQIHGFASQGFVHTNDNNWLTMNTSHVGSGEFTDFGLNASTQIRDNFRVGAQIFDRNLGKLGRWHPSLDWGGGDWRIKPWLGIRGGKVKTTLGLYTDSQDLDFLRVFVLLPQSVYSTDVRDATIAHTGGDIYGTFRLTHDLGDLAYTAYAGHRNDSTYSGYPYIISQFQVYFKTYGGLQYGGDIRWNTPVKGLLAGISRLDEDISGKGSAINPFDPASGLYPFYEHSRADWTNQYYGEYTAGKLRIDSEYRRYLRDEAFYLTSYNITDVRGWYISGAYPLSKRLALGSYYSRYTIVSIIGGPVSALYPNQTDTSLPANHIYDKVISARFDLKKFWNVKAEGHFMNGNGDSIYPDGFYPQQNPEGFKPNTNALVLKSSLYF